MQQAANQQRCSPDLSLPRAPPPLFVSPHPIGRGSQLSPRSLETPAAIGWHHPPSTLMLRVCRGSGLSLPPAVASWQLLPRHEYSHHKVQSMHPLTASCTVWLTAPSANHRPGAWDRGSFRSRPLAASLPEAAAARQRLRLPQRHQQRHHHLV